MLSHHAYYLEGSTSLFEALVSSIQKTENFGEHDPGLVTRVYEKCTIDDARELSQLGSLKNTSDRTVYCFSIGSIGSDAQQALLKTFEEPQLSTIYILLVPHGTLLPTLMSRMLPYPETIVSSKNQTDATTFISWEYKKRSDWIASLLKNEGDPRAYVLQFLQELEEILHTMIGKEEARGAIVDIERFRPYLRDTAPSLKMILEHFAITVPSIK